MAEATAYPTAKPAPAYNTVPVQTNVEPLALTPEEQAELEALYAELKPMATNAAREYVLARTPAKWQADMTALIDADWPVPEPPADEMQADGTVRRTNPNLASDDAALPHRGKVGPLPPKAPAPPKASHRDNDHKR